MPHRQGLSVVFAENNAKPDGGRPKAVLMEMAGRRHMLVGALPGSTGGSLSRRTLPASHHGHIPNTTTRHPSCHRLRRIHQYPCSTSKPPPGSSTSIQSATKRYKAPPPPTRPRTPPERRPPARPHEAAAATPAPTASKVPTAPPHPRPLGLGKDGLGGRDGARPDGSSRLG
jgi:hypothetical protein